MGIELPTPLKPQNSVIGSVGIQLPIHLIGPWQESDAGVACLRLVKSFM